MSKKDLFKESEEYRKFKTKQMHVLNFGEKQWGNVFKFIMT